MILNQRAKYSWKGSSALSKKAVSALVAVALLFSISAPAFASSHREAPMISGDPRADATDLYAFVSPDKTDTVTLIANYLPDQSPSGGPNFYNFDDNVMYEIKVDNDGDAVEDITYQFKFKTTFTNPNTFLYNTGPITTLDDPDWNYRQSYTLTRVNDRGEATVLGENLIVPPANVGAKSTPNYAALQSASIKNVNDGVTVFAGQSDDPFFVDLGGIFDLLTIRKLPGNMGGGVDALKGKNVLSLALQVPITQLTSNNTRPTDTKNPASVIGAWTTASRQSLKVLGSGDTKESKKYVQVSRLGSPLVNEVVIPLGQKDTFNGSKPSDDAQFANFVTNPELATLFKSIYSIAVPPQGQFGSTSQRDDLIAIFLTGIPNLTQPANVKASEQLRLNVAVPVSATANRLGVLAADNQGFPNGRRLSDDVVDISEQAVAGAAYPLFHPEFTPDPLATQLGDGVNSNDVALRNIFPYMALPFSGTDASGTSYPVVNEPSATPSPSPSTMVSATVAPSAAASPVGSASPIASASPTSAPSSSPVVPTGDAKTDKINAAVAQFDTSLNDAKNKSDQAIAQAQADFKTKVSAGGNINEAKDAFNNSFNQAKDAYNNSANQAKDMFNNSLNNI